MDDSTDLMRSDGTSEPARQAAASPISLKRIAWPLLLSLGVLGVIGALTFDPRSFGQMAAQMNLWLLAAAVGTLVLRVFSGGWRLSYISRGRVSLTAGVRGQLAWDFFSNVTPSAVGGGPFAAVYMARDSNIRVGEATALMLFAMLLDQLWFAVTIPIVIGASFFFEVIPHELGTVGTAAILLFFVGLLGWVVVFGYATVFRPELLQRFAGWVFRIRWLRRFRGFVDHEMRQLRRRALILRSQPLSFYANGLLLTFVTWLSRYLLLLFVVWSVFDEFDKLLLVLRSAAMMLGTIILPTPGGSGGIEGLYALFIGPMLPKAALAPTLLMWRVLGYYVFIGLGIFLSTHHVQKSMRRKRVEARAREAARPSPALPRPQPAESNE